MNAWPYLGAFAAFPKQNDKCPTKTRGGWVHLELTEQLASRTEIGLSRPQALPTRKHARQARSAREG